MTNLCHSDAISQLTSSLFTSSWLSKLVLFCAGALYPLAFSPVDFWPLAFLSIIFLLVVLLQLNENSRSSAFFIGFYWGLGCFALGASWVYISINQFGNAPWWLAGFLTLLFVIYLALFKGLFAYACYRMGKLIGHGWLVLVAPFFWVICEYLQATLFNGFPWLLAGYSQVDGAFFALFGWLGVYGVSWFVVAVAATIVLLLVMRLQRTKYLLVLAVLLAPVVLASFYAYVKQPDDAPKQIDVALVQPNIDQDIKWVSENFPQIIDILAKETLPLWTADLIVWPEGAIPNYAQNVMPLIEQLNKMAKANNSHLILGIPDYDAEKKLSFTTMKIYGEKPQTYQKQVLVPFGEYVPLQSWLRGLIDFFDLPMSDFSPALQSQSPFFLDDYSLIPAICYEIVYPDIVRQLSVKARQTGKPQLIVTISNDAWFGDSFGPYQHMQMARARALELAVPVLRATNDGITGFVAANGDIEKQMPRYVQGSIRHNVSVYNQPSLFARYGFVGLQIILLISAIFITFAVWRTKQH